MNQEKLDVVYMKMAMAFAELSYCKRSQVGAIVVKDGNIIACGFNGTPSGFENCCEEKNEDKTKPEVLHAESNCIAKIAKSTQSSLDAHLYVTMLPCLDCAKLIIQAGIKKVFYKDDYRNKDGLLLLDKVNISVINLSAYFQ